MVVDLGELEELTEKQPLRVEKKPLRIPFERGVSLGGYGPRLIGSENFSGRIAMEAERLGYEDGSTLKGEIVVFPNDGKKYEVMIIQKKD